jgi:preprotein translocase SecE subunit
MKSRNYNPQNNTFVSGRTQKCYFYPSCPGRAPVVCLTGQELPLVVVFKFVEETVAEEKSKRRVVKKSETVREKREKASDAPVKRRRVRHAVGKANTPVKAVGRGVAKAARPLNPLLAPFRLRPVRFIGRILYKILLIGYFVNSWRELRQVSWPNRRETTKLTIAVFVFAITFSLLVAVLDYGLDKVFKQLLV